MPGPDDDTDAAAAAAAATADADAVAPLVTTYLISAVGYNETPLHEFANQLPNIVLVNHVTKTCTVVPCSIARVRQLRHQI